LKKVVNLVGCSFKKSDLKIILIEQVRYKKSYFTGYAHINETSTAETPTHTNALTLPKTYGSNFVRRDLVQFEKHHS